MTIVFALICIALAIGGLSVVVHSHRQARYWASRQAFYERLLDQLEREEP
jgi:type II secretory pathway pseudopilin PulG